MSGFLEKIIFFFSCLGDVLSPVLMVVAIAGWGTLLYTGIRKRKKQNVLIAMTVSFFVLVCGAVSMIRVSSRYLLILLPAAILLAGYVLKCVWSRNRILALILGIGVFGFQGYKNFRIDPGIRKHAAYFRRLNAENAGRKAAVLLLDEKEKVRFAHYLALPCFSPVNWDVRTYDAGMPLRFWQRYIYVNDVVYLGFQPKAKQAFKISDFPCDGVCRVSLDYQEYKGRHRKKCVQFFRFDQVNHHVAFPESATSQQPLRFDPEAKKILPKTNQIVPEWRVFGEAVQDWRNGTSRYGCKRFPKHWEISMTGPKLCALRTENLDLSKPFDCYLEYSGCGPKPLEIRLVVQEDEVYRDSVVAFLPFDERNVNRSIKLSFYPEMNPEKKNTTIVIAIPEGGDLRIARLAFDRSTDGRTKTER